MQPKISVLNLFLLVYIEIELESESAVSNGELESSFAWSREKSKFKIGELAAESVVDCSSGISDYDCYRIWTCPKFIWFCEM